MVSFSDERCRSVHEDGERWADGAVRGQATMDGTTEIKLIRGNVVRSVPRETVRTCGLLWTMAARGVIV